MNGYEGKVVEKEKALIPDTENPNASPGEEEGKKKKWRLRKPKWLKAVAPQVSKEGYHYVRIPFVNIFSLFI